MILKPSDSVFKLQNLTGSFFSKPSLFNGGGFHLSVFKLQLDIELFADFELFPKSTGFISRRDFTFRVVAEGARPALDPVTYNRFILSSSFPAIRSYGSFRYE